MPKLPQHTIEDSLNDCEAELTRLRESYVLAIDDIQRWIKRWRAEGDEVDRLREALEEIDKKALQAGGGGPYGGVAHSIHTIARNALKETNG